jgi:hypothetical protein
LVTVGILIVTQVVEHQHDAKNLLTSDANEAVLSLEVSDSTGQALWRVRSSQGIKVSRVEYGQTPNGFRQEVPVGGMRPRPLVSGERLRLAIASLCWTFTHDGRAAEGQGFLGGVSTYSPRAEGRCANDRHQDG